MKHESANTPLARAATATVTPSRPRAYTKGKESPKPDSTSSPAHAAISRAKSVPPDITANSAKTRRTLFLNKPKFGDDAVGASHKGREVEEPPRVSARPENRLVVEQFARPRRQRPPDPAVRRGEDGSADDARKEMEEKLQLNDTLIKNLQSQVLALKAELEKAHSLNAELQSQNKKLSEELATAEAKMASLSKRGQKEGSNGECQSINFKDIQKLIANKLEHTNVKKEASSVRLPPAAPVHSVSRTTGSERKVPANSSLSPPPPPPLPPPPRRPARPASGHKSPGVVEFYHSLRRQEGKKDPSLPGNPNKSASISAHNSIVGEIQNRSAHLLAIKTDIETKGDFINGLIQKVLSASFTDIEDVVNFVDWLDGELSSLADERAVLKHFKWPERKADAMREAAVEYGELKLLESKISSYKDDTSIPCGSAMKKMASLLDKSERSIQKLVKLRNAVMHSYRDLHIPTDWMLDSGIVSKIKQASVRLAKMYMERVTKELELVRNSDRESTQEALVLQGVHFAYRAHQFAGGLDSETLCAFEEIRQRVPGNLRGSRELLAGIPSS